MQHQRSFFPGANREEKERLLLGTSNLIARSSGKEFVTNKDERGWDG